MNIYLVFDVEANGPSPGLYSMLEIGIVELTNLPNTFYASFKPLPELYDKFDLRALNVLKVKHEDTFLYDDPQTSMERLAEWASLLKGSSNSRFIMWSDNNGFDWQFLNYYCWRFLKRNPFGHSSQNINSLYKGLTGSYYSSFKKLRDTKHSHHPVDDALGNAEALIKMIKQFSLKDFPILE